MTEPELEKNGDDKICPIYSLLILFFFNKLLFIANITVVYVFSYSVAPINFSEEPLNAIFSLEPAGFFETVDCTVPFLPRPNRQ